MRSSLERKEAFIFKMCASSAEFSVCSKYPTLRLDSITIPDSFKRLLISLISFLIVREDTFNSLASSFPVTYSVLYFKL